MMLLLQDSGKGSRPGEEEGSTGSRGSETDFQLGDGHDELKQDALRKLIDRIELNLALGDLLQMESPGGSEASHERRKIRSMERLRKAKDNLCLSSAPLLPSVTAGPSSFWRKLLNVPAKLFLQEQIRFNRDLRVFVEELENLVHMGNDHLTELDARVSELEGTIGTSIGRADSPNEAQLTFESKLRGLEKRLDKIEDMTS